MKPFLHRWSKTARTASPTAFRLPVVAIGMLAVSGCVSTKYKFAGKEIAPTEPLNLATSQSPVEAALSGVIVFQGPGSWKKEAYWDEYIVSITNRGSSPLAIESAMLMGFAGTPQLPGADPWPLEKASRSAAERNFGLAKSISTQVGGGVATIGAAALIGAAHSAGAFGGAGLAALGGGLVAVPFAVGATIYRNVSGRHKIEAEFTRRRLVLPASIVPGGTARGSLFFPITPGPQRLILRGGAPGELRDVAIDLAPLAGLHLKSPPPAPGNGKKEPNQSVQPTPGSVTPRATE